MVLELAFVIVQELLHVTALQGRLVPQRNRSFGPADPTRESAMMVSERSATLIRSTPGVDWPTRRTMSLSFSEPNSSGETMILSQGIWYSILS